MKIFLQHRRTSLFFQTLDAWTANCQEAFDFREARKAIDFAHLYEIDDVQVVLMFGTSGRAQLVPYEIPGPSLATAQPRA